MEKWFDIKGYEGYYMISDCGEIKSKERVIPDGRFFKSKTKKPQLSKQGYLYVDLYKNGKRKHFYVHRLVAEVFIKKDCNSKLVINHINGIKTDNRIENLEWVTSSENNIHAKIIGLNKNFGTTAGRSKLTEKQLAEIRVYLKKGNIFQNDIAKKYNISASTVSDIKHKRRHNTNY